MQILIYSDNHGVTDNLAKIINRHQHEIDKIIHCGDSELTKLDPHLANTAVVKGNCDYGTDFPEEEVIKAGNLTVYITHGHLYGVKSDLLSLRMRAMEVGADIVCFGHTHELLVEEVEGVVYINPGSVTYPPRLKSPSYVIMTLKGDDIELAVYEVTSGKQLNKKVITS